MGGFGSGCWRQGKVLTKNCLQLDVRHLHREGRLVSGLSYNWEWRRRYRKTAAINIKTKSDRLILDYDHQQGDGDWEHANYPVPIEWTPCHYGGQRPWFICPAEGCGRRVAILYSGTHFACRHCHRLAYACQRENPVNRRLLRIDKIREQLGWEPGMLSDTGRKPKGMHWKTYFRLRDTLDDLFMQDMQYLSGLFRRNTNTLNR